MLEALQQRFGRPFIYGRNSSVFNKENFLRSISMPIMLMMVVLGCYGCGSGGDGGTINGGSGGGTGVATLSWTPPTTNADGTPLTDLAGFKVYYGTSSQNYTAVVDNKMSTSFFFESPFSPGTVVYFSVTAYGVSGGESDFSNEVSKVL